MPESVKRRGSSGPMSGAIPGWDDSTCPGRGGAFAMDGRIVSPLTLTLAFAYVRCGQEGLGMRRASRGGLFVVAMLAFGGPLSSAYAAFPGENGTIAFSSYQYVGGGNQAGGTWTIAADRSGESLLIEGAFRAAWSSDGSKLVYVRTTNEQTDIYASNADGSGEQRLTDDASNDSGPAWSPDGTMIAWASDRSGSYQIWAMKTGGSDPRQVTSLPGGRTA